MHVRCCDLVQSVSVLSSLWVVQIAAADVQTVHLH